MTVQEKKKVLIVEDDEVVQQLIRWRLDTLGYSVCGKAATGLEAIQIARNTHPDFVLMDIKLKGTMDGITTATLIKNELRTRIIFLTAFSDDDLLKRAKDVKPQGYILKPFDDTDLRIALELGMEHPAPEPV